MAVHQQKCGDDAQPVCQRGQKHCAGKNYFLGILGSEIIVLEAVVLYRVLDLVLKIMNQIDTNEKVCTICLHKAHSRSQLIVHIDSVHNDVRYNCKQCGKSVKNLRSHIYKVHTDPATGKMTMKKEKQDKEQNN